MRSRLREVDTTHPILRGLDGGKYDRTGTLGPAEIIDCGECRG